MAKQIKIEGKITVSLESFQIGDALIELQDYVDRKLSMIKEVRITKSDKIKNCRWIAEITTS